MRDRIIYYAVTLINVAEMYFLNPAYRVHFLQKTQAALFSEEENYFVQDEKMVSLIKIIHEKSRNLDALITENQDFASIVNVLVNMGIVVQVNKEYDGKIPHFPFWNSLKISSRCVREKLDRHVVSVVCYVDDPFHEIVPILGSLGIRAGENGTCYLVLVDDYLDPRLKQLSRELNCKNIPWLLVKTTGKTIWVGPLFNTSIEFSFINWDLLAMRIRENSHSKTDILGIEADELPLSVSVGIPTNRAIAYNLAANEILHWMIYGSTKLSNNVLTYNCLGPEIKIHHFSQFLKDFTKASAPRGSIKLQKSKKGFFSELGERSCSPEETYQKIEGFDSPITGFISQEYYRMENNFHIYYGTRSLHFHDNQKCIPPRPPDVVVGKSKDKREAKVAFIAEAIERYFSGDINLNKKVVASYKEVEGEAVHPRQLMGFSPTQYSNRHELNKQVGPYHWIPLPFNENAQISWVRLNSLTASSSKLFPASYCYMNFHSSQESLMCPGDSNGCATGNTFEEALFYGLLEVIERDSMAIWWYNRLKCPSVELSSYASSFIDNMRENFLRLDRSFRVLDISTELAIPAFVAISHLADGSRIVLGSGAHLSPQIGIQRAIAEHNQILTRATVPANIDLMQILPAERDLVKWLIHENIASHPFLQGEQSQKAKTRDDFKPLVSDFFDQDIRTCVDALAKSGLDVFWIPLTPSTFPLKVVKVIVPGMRHFWRRLGEGRLYTVPVVTKALESPLAEDQMNPISYFV